MAYMTTAVAPANWVSIAQAAEQLGVHPRTLRRYIRDGKLAVIRLAPQIVRIKPEELTRFLDGNMKVTTGTGTCYVPHTKETDRVIKPAKAARFSG